jgi:hypothetical protein
MARFFNNARHKQSTQGTKALKGWPRSSLAQLGIEQEQGRVDLGQTTTSQRAGTI